MTELIKSIQKSYRICMITEKKIKTFYISNFIIQGNRKQHAMNKSRKIEEEEYVTEDAID